MDKSTIVSGVLFSLAEVFAISSLVYVDWIHVGENAGSIVLGLTMQCQTIYGRTKSCYPPTLPAEWILALISLVSAIVALPITLGLLVLTKWKRNILTYAKWFAFISIGFLCLVGILFPIGFSQTVIGGEPYKLPVEWSLGASYKHLWVYSLSISCLGLFVLIMPIHWWMINR